MSEWTVDTLKEHLEALIGLANLRSPTKEEHAELLVRVAELQARLDRSQGEDSGKSDVVARGLATIGAVAAIGAVIVVVVHP